MFLDFKFTSGLFDFSRKLILKEAGFLGLAVARRGQWYQAAGPAPLVNPATIAIVGSAQAVVEYQPLKDCNLDLNRNPLLSLVLLQEVSEMKLCVASSC